MSTFIHGSRLHKEIIRRNTDYSSCLICASSLRWCSGLQMWVCPEGCDLRVKPTGSVIYLVEEERCPGGEDVGEHNVLSTGFCNHPGCPNYRRER